MEKTEDYFHEGIVSSTDWRNQPVNNAIQQPSLSNPSALFGLRAVLPPTVIKVEMRWGKGATAAENTSWEGGDQKDKQKAPKEAQRIAAERPKALGLENSRQRRQPTMGEVAAASKALSLLLNKASISPAK